MPRKSKGCCRRGHKGTHEEYQAAERERQRALYARRRAHELARRRSYHERHPERSREQARRYRTRKRTNPVEPYRDRDIFERDGWRCGICGRKVSPDLAYPHPMSATIDHIIPVSDGGADSPLNVRLAHLRCNVARGARGHAQLRLIA